MKFCSRPWFFSDGTGQKRRPVLVVHDFGDSDLLVVPVTSQPARISRDVVVVEWKSADLMLPSVVRLEKFATIENTCVLRKLGEIVPDDLTKVEEELTTVFDEILP